MMTQRSYLGRKFFSNFFNKNLSEYQSNFSVQAKQTRVSHCFGPRNCQNKVSQLRIPSWDTYSTFEVLADHISTKNKYGKKVMIFITGKIKANLKEF